MIMSPTRLHTDTYALSTTIAKQHSTPLLFTHHTTHLPNTSYTFTSIIHTHPLMKYRCKNNEGSLLLGSSSPNSRKKRRREECVWRCIAVEEHAFAHIIHGPHPEGRVATGATCGERAVEAPRHIGVNVATVDSRTQHAGGAALRE